MRLQSQCRWARGLGLEDLIPRKLTAVQGPRLLVSYWQEASMSHHGDLATGLCTWQLTTLRMSNWRGVTEGEEGGGRRHNVFYKLSLEMIPHFYHILSATQTTCNRITQWCKYQEAVITGGHLGSWPLRG